MTAADSYRKLAAQLRAKAANERSAGLASELNHLAWCYLRLAEQADHNSLSDIIAEFGSKLGSAGA
ncbi:MAG TPA: hypothetical protein VGV41_19465 [Pseudolabrys sp.]|jgi:hypothetical protein|nr:hypothetical protein [Pseudolabrys sp.]